MISQTYFSTRIKFELGKQTLSRLEKNRGGKLFNHHVVKVLCCISCQKNVPHFMSFRNVPCLFHIGIGIGRAGLLMCPHCRHPLRFPRRYFVGVLHKQFPSLLKNQEHIHPQFTPSRSAIQPAGRSSPRLDHGDKTYLLAATCRKLYFICRKLYLSPRGQKKKSCGIQKYAKLDCILLLY